jgi:hypothetical protein
MQARNQPEARDKQSFYGLFFEHEDGDIMCLRNFYGLLLRLLCVKSQNIAFLITTAVIVASKAIITLVGAEYLFQKYLKISNAIPVTGRAGLWGCAMLRIPYCLDSRLTDGGKFVSLANRPRSTLHNYCFFDSGTHFY